MEVGDMFYTPTYYNIEGFIENDIILIDSIKGKIAFYVYLSRDIRASRQFHEIEQLVKVPLVLKELYEL